MAGHSEAVIPVLRVQRWPQRFTLWFFSLLSVWSSTWIGSIYRRGSRAPCKSSAGTRRHGYDPVRFFSWLLLTQFLGLAFLIVGGPKAFWAGP